MSFTKNTFWIFLPISIVFILSINLPFFWDTIHLSAGQALWFYNNSFKDFLLPNQLDTGHPTLFSMLLAVDWMLLGKGLWQSHLLMVPFLFLLVKEIIHVTALYFGDKYTWVAILIVLNPILLAQSFLVSPDIVVFGMFFLLLSAIKTDKNFPIVWGTMVLCLVSLRGMMVAASMSLFLLGEIWKTSNHSLDIRQYKRLLAFFPGFILGIAFLAIHYTQKGWIGFHANSPWADSFAKSNGFDVLFNVGKLVWRILDFGMIFFFIITLVQLWQKKIQCSTRTKELLWLLASLFVFLIIPQLLYKYLLLHRYLFPFIIVLVLLSLSFLEEHLDTFQFKQSIYIAIPLMMAGMFITYPDYIAKGWDATPAHFAYYTQRKKALAYMHQHHIPLSETGGGFPYYAPSSIVDLSTDTSAFAPLDFTKNNYILYSNISNDFNKPELKALNQEWIKLAQFGQWPVRFEIYKRNQNK